MRLVCISDTHGDHEGLELPAGDVLIHAGDITSHGREQETRDFFQWLGSRRFDTVICVAGNHDTFVEAEPKLAEQFASDNKVNLLNDSALEVGGVSFWGSPITPRFHDWSFMRDPGAPIEAHWNQIPETTDVLITHGPPFGILDQVERPDGQQEHTGCPSLLTRVQGLSLKLHIFGHIHECHGSLRQHGVAFHNVCTMNQFYRRAYSPVVIDL